MENSMTITYEGSENDDDEYHGFVDKLPSLASFAEQNVLAFHRFMNDV